MLNETPYILRISIYNTRHEICVTNPRIGYPTIEQIAKYTFPPTDSARTVSSYIVHEMILGSNNKFNSTIFETRPNAVLS